METIASEYDLLNRFYADHMTALDEGDVARWSSDFLPEATFAASGLDAPLHGAGQIERAAAAGHAARAESGLRHRHLVSMLRLQPRTPTMTRATSYVLVVESRIGGESAIHASTLCEDLLIRRDEGWRIRFRRVTRDDKPWQRS
ncbi:SnoaL-like domain-containing protein [Nocardia nova SH22a]|uniref:SnoaL-like domain-containing protein n=1 Tax=Nocardia nova SH22a TaxID=1415166 RepID=W5T9A1_9NOCA|nr:nuclear transport factor 2 family protein [Nocardia nova]AHH15890.1 SnoaL-like domain-containing protein [Nocardia nova SH22a]